MARPTCRRWRWRLLCISISRSTISEFRSICGTRARRTTSFPIHTHFKGDICIPGILRDSVSTMTKSWRRNSPTSGLICRLTVNSTAPCSTGSGTNPKPIRGNMPYKLLDLAGKVAVVVGGSSGIGKTIALGLAEAGADVVSSARRIELVKTLAEEIESLGRRSLRVTCDVADRESLDKLLKACLDAFGKVDIMVNAAGITKRAPTLDFSEADWNRIMDTNLTGTLRVCQVFGRHM